MHALAQAQWPLGERDMPANMQKYLPLIKAGAQLSAVKREQERIWLSTLINKPALSASGFYAVAASKNDPRAKRFFTLMHAVAAKVSKQTGYNTDAISAQIERYHWQNAWRDMRRSGRLCDLFTNHRKRSRQEQQAYFDCRSYKAHKVG